MLVLICVCLSVQGPLTQPAGLVAASPVRGVHPGICPQQQRVVCPLAPQCASRQCLRVSQCLEVWQSILLSVQVMRQLAGVGTHRCRQTTWLRTQHHAPAGVVTLSRYMCVHVVHSECAAVQSLMLASICLHMVLQPQAAQATCALQLTCHAHLASCSRWARERPGTAASWPVQQSAWPAARAHQQVSFVHA